MSKINKSLAVFFSIIVFILIAGCKKKPPKVFYPVVAGKFYPSDTQELKEMINRFLSQVEPMEVKGRVFGVIAPHAGYIYSAQVGAYSFKALKQGNKTTPSTVIILALSHRVPFNGASVLMYDYYSTPLGEVKINTSLGKKLLKNDIFIDDERIFQGEHSAEVEIPFIQTLFPEARILPILFGRLNLEEIKKAAEILSEILKEKRGKYVFVASSDLSHYHPYEIAKDMDLALLNKITLLSLNDIFKNVSTRTYEMCGFFPVMTALFIAQNLGLKPVFLEYKNSGDTVGGKERVVGYGAVAFVKNGTVKVLRKKRVEEKEEEWVSGKELSDADKKFLLKIARKTLEKYVRKRTIPEVHPEGEVLKKKGAVFVTLKKNGILRGCIGGLSAVEPLYLAVQHMTVSSCSKDPRFFPVKAEELKDITIEISVLSPPIRVKDPLREIKIGRDGLIIEYSGRRGVLLPQVPVEYSWDLQTYLMQICRKAGLPPDTWKKDGVRLYRFSAFVFSEL